MAQAPTPIYDRNDEDVFTGTPIVLPYGLERQFRQPDPDGGEYIGLSSFEIDREPGLPPLNLSIYGERHLSQLPQSERLSQAELRTIRDETAQFFRNKLTEDPTAVLFVEGDQAKFNELPPTITKTMRGTVKILQDIEKPENRHLAGRVFLRDLREAQFGNNVSTAPITFLGGKKLLNRIDKFNLDSDFPYFKPQVLAQMTSSYPPLYYSGLLDGDYLERIKRYRSLPSGNLLFYVGDSHRKHIKNALLRGTQGIRQISGRGLVRRDMYSKSKKITPTYTLSKSNKPEKKFMVSFKNPKTNRNKTIHFGSAGMDDYTISKDPEQKQRYIIRHSAREDWNNLSSSGAWAKNILWNQTTLRSSIKDMEKKFKIKIIYNK
jgi:hypothetical protein